MSRQTFVISAPEAALMQEVSRLLEAGRKHGDTWEQLSQAEAHLSDAHRALAGAATNREDVRDALEQLRSALREAEQALAADID